MNKFKLLVVGVAMLTFDLKAQEVKTIEVKPVGVYAEIDIDGQNLMMKQLYDPVTRNASIDTIFNNITRYNPPVLYLFSQALYLNGEKESAVQWYLYAQLNAMFDAARCADNSAKQAVVILEDNIRPMLAVYLKQNKAVETKSAQMVLDLFKKLQPSYDIRWINLHGMGAFTGAFGEELPKETSKLTEDKSLWPDLLAKVLKEFAGLHGVRE
jgi:hypothetical protein